MKKQVLCAGALFGFLAFSTGSFAQITPAFAAPQTNPFSLTDIGDWSAPEFVDLDDDGDLDMMSGEQGGDWYYFQNTGTATAPAFAAAQNNPFGLTTIGVTSTLDFADVDNDGDYDMMGFEMSGNFKYFQNTGTATAPAFAAVQTNPMGIVAPVGTAFYNPTFGDMDVDTDFDMMIGNFEGDFIIYRNNGTVTAPDWSSVVTNFFGLANQTTLSSPEWGDLDNDGDLDMISGENSGTGNLNYTENTAVTAGPPTYTTAVSNPYGLTAIGGNVLETGFGDLDSDTDLDLIVGNTTGNFYYFENIAINAGFADLELGGVKVYPNPSNGMVNVICPAGADQYNYTVSALSGEVVAIGMMNGGSNEVDMTSVENGIYILTVENGGKTSIQKLVKK